MERLVEGGGVGYAVLTALGNKGTRRENRVVLPIAFHFGRQALSKVSEMAQAWRELCRYTSNPESAGYFGVERHIGRMLQILGIPTEI
jgi:hypothetical protein